VPENKKFLEELLTRTSLQMLQSGEACKNFKLMIIQFNNPLVCKISANNSFLLH